MMSPTTHARLVQTGSPQGVIRRSRGVTWWETCSSAALGTRYRRVLCLCLLTLVSQNSLLGQQPTVTEHRSDGPVDASSDEGIAALEAQLSKLIEATARLGKQLESGSHRSADDHSQNGASSVGGETVTVESSAKSIREIRERIKLLRRMRQRNAIESGHNDLVEVHLADHPTTPGRQTNQPSLVAIEQSLNDNNVSGDQPQPVTAPAIEATKVFSSPVNTLELGQSLYRTKNYTAALRALEAVDVDTLSDSDRHWLGLLIALCQRRLGQTDVAEARLREIANANSTDYPIPVARWWLKQTSLLRETRPILDGISTELDSLIERSKQHVQQ